MVIKKLFNQRKLTKDETQDVITPFAFKLNQSVFGTPIANPYKRAIAILIDLLLIAILSSAGGEMLAVAIAVMAFRLGSKRRANEQGVQQGYKRRTLARFIGAFIVLVVLLDNVAPMVNRFLSDHAIEEAREYNQWQEQYGNTKNGNIPSDIIEGAVGTEMGISEALTIAGLTIKVVTQGEQRNCQDVDCWGKVMDEVPKAAKKLKLNDQQAQTLFAKIVGELGLNDADSKQLRDDLMSQYNGSNKDQPLAEGEQDENPANTDDSDARAATSNTPVSAQAPAQPHEISSAIDNTQLGQLRQQKSQRPADAPRRPVYSIIEYVKAIIDDLGLGFGWAALYFTVFTSWWQGQTPGKRLMGIRVLQLDGTPLSVWDSFGRYGGYGAGIATGLLGFLQIYWDPNRQAIHDKISATVVIDERKKVDQAIIDAAKASAQHPQDEQAEDEQVTETTSTITTHENS
ncbi:RDD family protein [Thalassotalea ponticola]|uniref:RDD family protein n=1 Tax=Thalassotalea ponticola TaxID=1523392 RepID=UPI0025B61F94|nr:RDD family protein [Thalassotalea ponticola]MDN3652893.1 RDD family protein [Thalassotalea ponticola]